jgi:hypothetical protein
MTTRRWITAILIESERCARTAPVRQVRGRANRT